jgi:hypothetical protein
LPLPTGIEPLTLPTGIEPLPLLLFFQNSETVVILSEVAHGTL